jgi:hypothetical protein
MPYSYNLPFFILFINKAKYVPGGNMKSFGAFFKSFHLFDHLMFANFVGR